MVGKRVQFDDETWQAVQAIARQTGKSFQEVASAAFADFLKKHNQPVGFKAALEASVTSRSKVKSKEGLMPRFDNLSAEELEQIRRFIEETDIDVISDEMRALVEKNWPWLFEKLPPRVSH
jgi:predicted transcriptional regulator